MIACCSLRFICCVGVRRFPGTTGFDWDFYAWQDSYVEDFFDTDLPSSFMAEGARECRHGSVSGLFYVLFVNVLV